MKTKWVSEQTEKLTRINNAGYLQECRLITAWALSFLDKDTASFDEWQAMNRAIADRIKALEGSGLAGNVLPADHGVPVEKFVPKQFVQSVRDKNV